MATYGKPTTSFYVNFGDLAPAAAQRALAPVLIAPRYKLHKVSNNDTFLMTFPETAPDAPEVYAWPFKVADNYGVVDKQSVRVLALNAKVKINASSLDGKVTSTEPNCVTLDNSVRTANKETTPADINLQGFAVNVGDIAIVNIPNTDGDEGTTRIVRGEIVDIAQTYTDPEITCVGGATGEDASSVVLINPDSKFNGLEDASYLLTIDENGAGTVLALLGDSGYVNNVSLSADEYTAIGDFGIEVKLAGAAVAGSYIISGTPGKIDKYNKIYIAADLGISGDEPVAVTVDFLSSTLATRSELSSAYWDITDAGVKLADTIKTTVAGHSLTIAEAAIHVEYREQLVGDIMELRSVQSAGIVDWVGEAAPENPMGMMYAAAANAGSTAFFYVMSCEDTEESTIRCIDYVAQFENVYAFVPYVQTVKTQSAVKNAIAKYSNPQIAQFKHAWFAPTSAITSDIYTRDKQGSILVGSVDADGILTIVGTTIDIIGNKVKAGDLVVFADGKSYEVSRVVSKSKVELKGSGEMIGYSQLEFKRKLSSSAYAEALAKEARTINDKRVNLVVADELYFGGYANVSKAYLCAALAAMRCSLPPHAPMNELQVPGFAVNDTLKWTDVDYDKMNAGGCWVVARNSEGDLVTYHQITTLTDGTIAEEDSVVSNADEIVRRLRRAVRPFASGKSNVTTALINKIRAVLVAELTQLQAEYYADIYGSRILGFSIDQLYIPEGNKRSLICSLSISLPQPMQDGRLNFNLF